VIHLYLGYNTVAIQKQLMGITSLFKEMSGKSTSVTDSTHFIHKAVLCSGSDDVGHISEEVISTDTILYGASVTVHFPVEFQVWCTFHAMYY
jgi:hypothetical protein